MALQGGRRSPVEGGTAGREEVSSRGWHCRVGGGAPVEGAQQGEGGGGLQWRVHSRVRG